MHVMDGSGRKTAFAVAATAFQGLGVGLADVDRLELGEEFAPSNWAMFLLRRSL
jgi:hypothetical protein